MTPVCVLLTLLLTTYHLVCPLILGISFHVAINNHHQHPKYPSLWFVRKNVTIDNSQLRSDYRTKEQQQQQHGHKRLTRSSSINLTNLEESQLNDGFTNDQNLECIEQEVEELGEECSIIKYYNREIAESATAEREGIELTHHCACALSNMRVKWYKSFLGPLKNEPQPLDLDRLVRMVENVRRKNESAAFLWNDAEITALGISIYSATNDFFYQQQNNPSLRITKKLRKYLEKDDIWMLVLTFCRRIADDHFKLFRYLENLNRINPSFFGKLLDYSQPIGRVFTASRACKLLVMLNYEQYQLRPVGQEYLPDYPIYILNILRRTPNETSSLIRQVKAENPFTSSLMDWSTGDNSLYLDGEEL